MAWFLGRCQEPSAAKQSEVPSGGSVSLEGSPTYPARLVQLPAWNVDPGDVLVKTRFTG